MQAVGSEVYVVLIPVAVLAILCLLYVKQRYPSIRRYVMGPEVAAPDPVNHNPAFAEAQCAVCLDDPKKFEVSATCGHSYCGACLFQIYERTQEKIVCPLCRKPITTIFKTFRDSEQPADEKARILVKIHDYNMRFDDNRPLIRRLQQLPYMLRRTRRYLTDPRFWILFLRSLHFFRVIMMALVYLILPLDLIPERLFGLFGLVDDFFITITFVCIGLALFVPIFVRGRAQ